MFPTKRRLFPAEKSVSAGKRRRLFGRVLRKYFMFVGIAVHIYLFLVLLVTFLVEVQKWIDATPT